jgi:hypothetical protein
MGDQATPDAVLEPLSAKRRHLGFRLGVQLRDPLRPEPLQGSLLPVRFVRIQVASPPPRRVDGTEWEEGLRMSTGDPFEPRNPPADGMVSPLQGIAPLGQPRPATIVLDRWLAVPAVPPTRALTRTFTLAPPDPKFQPISCLSVRYLDGTPLGVAGVTYYCEGELTFDRPADGDWIAVSLDRFFPPERGSADYIVRLEGSKVLEGLEAEQQKIPVRYPINPVL